MPIYLNGSINSSSPGLAPQDNQDLFFFLARAHSKADKPENESIDYDDIVDGLNSLLNGAAEISGDDIDNLNSKFHARNFFGHRHVAGYGPTGLNEWHSLNISGENRDVVRDQYQFWRSHGGTIKVTTFAEMLLAAMGKGKNAVVSRAECEQYRKAADALGGAEYHRDTAW